MAQKMELTNIAILCMIIAMAGAAMAMENEAAVREHVLDTVNERNRYESITINKPVMRFDYRQPSPVALSQQGVAGGQEEGHVRQFDDDITGPPSPSVRCFCNLPSCISTGYMCKSHYGGCFSDVFQHYPPALGTKTAYRGRHGCIELLTDKAQRERCQRLPNGNRYPASARSASKSDEYDHPRSLVHCCHEDMCNHADNPQTKDLINDTALGDLDESRVIGSQINTGYSDSDVWFKAATIAVPICGAVILFVLIALAIRLLKTESMNNTNYKLGCSYLHRKQSHNCKHHAQPYCQPVAAEPFLRKDPIVHDHAEMIYPRRSLPAPITLTKNINERFNSASNSSKQYNYNLLPMRNNNDVRVHEMAAKCYDNKMSAFVTSVTPPPSSQPVASDVVQPHRRNDHSCEEHTECEWKLNNLASTSSIMRDDNVTCDNIPKNITQNSPQEDDQP